MTANRKKKLSARDLAAGTGLSYTAALRSLDSRQVPGPGEDRPVPPVPPGLIEARHAGRCDYCGRKNSPGARIAAHRERCGTCPLRRRHATRRPLLAGRAGPQHPTVEIPLRIAAGYEASGDEEGVRRCRADAEAAMRKLVGPVPASAARPGRIGVVIDEGTAVRCCCSCCAKSPGAPSPAARGGKPALLRQLDLNSSRHDPEHAHR